MENNNQKFQEQQAPLKNSDKAFVQVGKNGEPVIPDKTSQKEVNPREEVNQREQDRNPAPDNR